MKKFRAGNTVLLVDTLGENLRRVPIGVEILADDASRDRIRSPRFVLLFIAAGLLMPRSILSMGTGIYREGLDRF